jgi:hypothetical protein
MTNDDILLSVYIVLIVVCIILLLWYLADYLPINGETRFERELKQNYNNLHGDTFGTEAKHVIENARRIPVIDTMNRYRLGTTYLIHANQPALAEQEFKRVRQDIFDGALHNNEALYIVDRLNDFRDLFIEDIEMEDDIDILLFLHDNIRNDTEKKKKEVKIDPNDPEKTQKLILAEQYWISDPQNVHDSAISNLVKEQFQKIKLENDSRPELAPRTYEEAKKYALANSKDRQQVVRSVFDVFDHGYSSPIDSSMKENEYVETIWKRIHDRGNEKRIDELKDAFVDAICDCVEKDNVVCAGGRAMKLWQTFEFLDKDETIGKARSKQMIRNEIIEQAARIVDVELKSVPTNVLDDYNNNKETEETKELLKRMHNKFNDLHDLYKDKLDGAQLDIVIEQCRAVL